MKRRKRIAIQAIVMGIWGTQKDREAVNLLLPKMLEAGVMDRPTVRVFMPCFHAVLGRSCWRWCLLTIFVGSRQLREGVTNFFETEMADHQQDEPMTPLFVSQMIKKLNFRSVRWWWRYAGAGGAVICACDPVIRCCTSSRSFRIPPCPSLLRMLWLETSSLLTRVTQLPRRSPSLPRPQLPFQHPHQPLPRLAPPRPPRRQPAQPLNLLQSLRQRQLLLQPLRRPPQRRIPMRICSRR